MILFAVEQNTFSAEQIRQDANKHTMEADSYLRTKYPGIFPQVKNIVNFSHNDSADAFRHAYDKGQLAINMSLVN